MQSKEVALDLTLHDDDTNYFTWLWVKWSDSVVKDRIRDMYRKIAGCTVN